MPAAPLASVPLVATGSPCLLHRVRFRPGARGRGRARGGRPGAAPPARGGGGGPPGRGG
ncbi:hypothetical protein GHU11_14580, partial [Pseudomonas aeruginosa]|nr:hypothetical protein [Pseudomonas aeruginosa]